MKSSYPFLSSCRTFEWQRSRQANASPVLLSGRLVKRHAHENSWSGLSLDTSNSLPLSSTQATQSSRYWEEFTNGKRTIDPSYSEIQHSRSQSAPRHPSDLGFRSKSVTRDGKAVLSNTSSKGNILNGSEFSPRFKGLELYRQQDIPTRKGRGQSEYYLRLSISQIDTLPGTTSPLPGVPERVPKPSRKNISQIETLPGWIPMEDKQQSVESSYKSKYFKRNLATSEQTEEVFGSSPSRTSPVKREKPIRKDMERYRDVGREVGEDQRLKGGQNLYRTNRETQAESRLKRCLGKRPQTSTDLFTATFRLF